ncbi:predicted protein [Nematostella vectensis]|uniref:ZP domain-containing protein n=1 Tax=Nematostella vectensis TaxID=45351 RepID=A7SFX2_NEMVE|nr:predicted protein [Nematostella vectensis]|eukprot:XP_001629464.1 predicted protein [Nematostella vectensis]
MTVYLRRDFLADFYLEDLRLRDTSCEFQSSQNWTHFELVVPLMRCGTESRHTNESLIYSNIVRQKPIDPNAFINRMPIIEIPLQCAYAKRVSATYVDLETTKKKLDLNIRDGAGEFSLRMDLYKDSTYSDPIKPSSFPLSVTVNARLYFQLLVDTPDKSLSIIADACYATPNRAPSEKARYDIITDKCPRDATLQTHPSPHSGAQRFSFQSFQFVSSKGTPHVFIHCEVRVCKATDESSSCARGCEEPLVQKRLKRSERENEDVYNLERGPIILVLVDRPEPHPERRGDRMYVNTDDPMCMFFLCSVGVSAVSMPWILVAMGVVCLLCLVVVGYTQRELWRAKREKDAWDKMILPEPDWALTNPHHDGPDGKTSDGNKTDSEIQDSNKKESVTDKISLDACNIMSDPNKENTDVDKMISGTNRIVPDPERTTTL